MINSEDFYDTSFRPEAYMQRKQERMHPSPEEMLMKHAVKFLTSKQRKLWEAWNYSGLTQQELAKQFKITQSSFSRSITQIENRLTKHIKSNMGTYALLKEEYSNDDSVGC